MKLKNRSLKSQIWFYLAIFSTLLILLLWLLQVMFFDKYYESRTSSELSKLALKTKYYYKNSKDTSSYDKLSYNNNACIEIIKDNKIVYTSNAQRRGCIIDNDNTLNMDYRVNFINSDEDKETYQIVNPLLNNKTLVSAIKLDNDAYAFINVSLEPTDPAISIIREELIYISIAIYISSFIIAYFISKHISLPIDKLNREVAKMSKGDLVTPFDENSNINEIKELSITLNKTKKELSKIEETRKDLLANVSHDLKTPLTMIKAYSEMARDLNSDNKEKREENLNVIIEETERLNLLVNDILSLSKSEKNIDILSKEKFNLTTLIETIVRRFDYLKEEGYSFIFDSSKDYIINADKQKIEQVIYNLISNAINYTGEDKKITIELVNNKKYLRVYVIDTGKGIDKNEIDLIWDKYYKNEKNHKRNKVGTGLGLSIVKDILIKHGFNYGVISNKGKGSKFYFDVNI